MEIATIASVRLIATGFSTFSTIRTLINNCAQYIYYKDEKGELYEISWKYGAWISKNLTQTSKVPLSASAPSCFCKSNGSIYVYYYNKDGHIIQLKKTASSEVSENSNVKRTGEEIWRVKNISEQVKIIHVRAVGNLIAWTGMFVLPYDYICFVDSNGRFHEISKFRARSEWKHRDITLDFSCKLSIGLPFPNQIEDERRIDENGEIFVDCEEGDNVEDLLSFVQIDSNKVDETFKHVYRGIIENDPFLDHHLNESIRKLKVSYGQFEGSNAESVREKKQNFLSKLVQLLMRGGILKGSISSNSDLNSQYIYYYGIEGSIHLLRCGTGAMRYPNAKDVDEEPALVFEGDSEQRITEATSSNPGLASKIFGAVRNTVGYTSSLALSLAFSSWRTFNIGNFLSDDIIKRGIPISSPVSHAAFNSQHLFYISYPSYHLIHLYWSLDNYWHYEDLTQIVPKAEKANPRVGLVSYSTSLSHYVFYSDYEGRIHQLYQSLLKTSAKWEDFDVTSFIEEKQKFKKISPDDPHLILPCASLLSACVLPLSKETDAVAVYFKDSIGQLFSLENVNNFSIKPTLGRKADEESIYSEWNCRNLFAEKTLNGKLGVIGNEGSISTFTKGMLESISTAATISGESVVNTMREWASLGKNSSDQKEYELVETPKTNESVFARKLRELKESNEILSSKVVELEIMNTNIMKEQKDNKENESELEKVRQKHLLEIEIAKKTLKENEEKEMELMETHRKELEELRLQNEELQSRLEKIKQEKEQKEYEINIITGGMGYEAHRKIHQNNLKKIEEEEETNPECSICMDNPPQVEQKCGHKTLCEECYAKMLSQNKSCTICYQPLE